MRRILRVTPPEHEFTQARVAVTAHDDEIGFSIGGVRKEHVGDIDVAGDNALDLDGKSMAGNVGLRPNPSL